MESENMKQGIFNKAIVTIYEEPALVKMTKRGMESTISDEGLYGHPFTLLEDENAGYIKIRTHYNYEGYVPVSDVLFLSMGEWESSAEKLWITKSYGDVMTIPAVQGAAVISLPRGAVLKLDGREEYGEGYVKVRLFDGREGYIKKTYTKPYTLPLNSQPDLSEFPNGKPEEEEFRKKVVATAKNYLGTQYRWGGKTPLGIDCSGLTSMSYMLNGVLTFRDAKIKEGFPVKEIAFEDKKPGDLLYFPGHIAMYIGNNEYIHSTGHEGSDGVVINSLDEKADNYREDLPGKLLMTGSIF